MRIKILNARSALWMLCCLTISLMSCERDLYDEGIKTPSRSYVIEEVRFDEIDPAKSKDFKRLFGLGNSLTAKMEYQAGLGLSVDFERGVRIVGDSIETYTFPAEIAGEEQMKNLIAAFKPDGTSKYYLMQYNYTADEIKNIMSQPITENTPEILATFLKQAFFHNVGDIMWVEECDVTVTEEYPTTHEGDLHGTGGDIYDTVTTVHYTNCWTYGIINDSGGGSSGGSSGGTSGGGGSAGSGGGGSGYDGSAPEIHGNQGTIVTVPVFPEADDTPITKPCEELQKLLENIDIKAAIIAVENAASQDQYETGQFVMLNPDGNMTPGVIESSSNECSEIDFTPLQGWLGFFHDHPFTCLGSGVNYPIFSHQDLAMFYKTIKNFSPNEEDIQLNRDKFFAGVGVKNGSTSYTYALKIDNLAVFTNQMNLIYGTNADPTAKINFEGALLDLQNKLFENSFDVNMPDQDDIELTFLKFITQKYYLGVSLYKLDSEHKTWSKLKIENGRPKSLPCT